MIVAKFKATLSNVKTEAVTQWDYGRQLRIEGLHLPSFVSVDFGINGSKTTARMLGSTVDGVTVVDIPNELLKQSADLVAYVYVTTETEGKTVKTIYIPMNSRAKPEEYTEPEEQRIFDDAVNAMNAAADRAETARDEAKSSADQARASEEATAKTAEAFTDTAESAVNAVNDAGAANTRAINEKGAEAVSAVNTAGETQKQTVQKAGNNAIEDIGTAKAEALTEIQTEGANQLQNIELAAADVVANREQIEESKDLAIVCEAEGESIVLKDSAKARFRGMRIFGKSTQDGTPTPDNPQEIHSVENPDLSIHGKNLLPYPYTISDMELCGVAVKVRSDGSILLNGTATQSGGNLIQAIDVDNIKKILCLSGASVDKTLYASCYNNGKYMKDIWVDGENGFNTIDNSDGLYTRLAVALYVRVGHTYNNVVIKPQIEISETPTECEMFKEPQTITLPHTLPGIPVSSGGNYTDANGQQWICDEIDLARGVKVQRVYHKVFDGTETLSNNWYPAVVFNLGIKDYVVYNTKVFCNYFATADIGNIYGTTLKFDGVDAYGFGSADEVKAFMLQKYTEGVPMEVFSVLQTPIETPLSEAEIQAYKALLSNKPTTTLLNDSGAFMAVSYVADTKIYIDNKIKEMMEGA